MKASINLIFGSLFLLVAAVMGWAFYQVLVEGTQDILIRFGVENMYAQNGLILSIGLILLVLLSAVSGANLWSGIKKAFNLE